MQASEVTGTGNLTIAQILANLGGDPKAGLTDADLQECLKKYGPNALVVGDWGDFAIINSLLLFNAVLGFWEEHETSNALEALKSPLALKARALRNGKMGADRCQHACAWRHRAVISRRRRAC